MYREQSRLDPQRKNYPRHIRALKFLAGWERNKRWVSWGLVAVVFSFAMYPGLWFVFNFDPSLAIFKGNMTPWGVKVLFSIVFWVVVLLIVLLTGTTFVLEKAFGAWKRYKRDVIHEAQDFCGASAAQNTPEQEEVKQLLRELRSSAGRL